MQIKVIRSVFTDTTTLGQMLVNDSFFAYTLEDTNRNLNGDCSKKVQNETCIDAGTYNVVVNHSAHFNKDLPQILNVPCFEGIRIHGGNTAKDTEGCILIGAKTNHIDWIGECGQKVLEIISLIRNAADNNESVTIEIMDNHADA